MDKGISQTSNLSVSQRDYLQKLKVALATVIIRTKPPDLSSREFAAKLSLQLKKGEESWKEKAKKLEEELLQTKQELLLAELRPKENAVSNHETKGILIECHHHGKELKTYLHYYYINHLSTEENNILR